MDCCWCLKASCCVVKQVNIIIGKKGWIGWKNNMTLDWITREIEKIDNNEYSYLSLLWALFKFFFLRCPDWKRELFKTTLPQTISHHVHLIWSPNYARYSVITVCSIDPSKWCFSAFVHLFTLLCYAISYNHNHLKEWLSENGTFFICIVWTN